MADLDLKLVDLNTNNDFTRRHIGPDAVDESAMLAELGMDSLDELIGQVVAPSIRHDKPLAGKDSMSERQVLNRLYEQSTRNQLYKSFIGQGYHITETPSVIERNILGNPAGTPPINMPHTSPFAPHNLRMTHNDRNLTTTLCGDEHVEGK